MTLSRLSGKRILISGASRGIGLAISEAVAQNGAATLLAGRSESLAGTAERLNGMAIPLDLTDPASIEEAVDIVQHVDVLVNVAGANLRKRFEDYSPQEVKDMFQVNLFGPMQLTQGIGAKMIREGKGGKIINIGSLTTLLGLPFLSIYGATKGAIGQWTKCLAAEWGCHNVQVNCIAPGFFLTDLNREVWKEPKLANWIARSQPNSRLGRVDEVGSLAVYLASNESDYVTGQIFAIDGGHSTTSLWPYEPEV